MKSPHFFLIKPKGDEYQNDIEIAGQKITVNSTVEDHRHVNRFAEVLEVPIHYEGPIKKGDTLVVHHNIFRIYYDMKGRPRKSPNYFKEGVYLIEPLQFYLYHNGTEWNAVDEYCFVKPIDKENSYLHEEGEEENTGVMVYSNQTLESRGVKSGDKVHFTKNSEYEFVVNDERIYRMNTRDICVAYG